MSIETGQIRWARTADGKATRLFILYKIDEVDNADMYQTAMVSDMSVYAEGHDIMLSDLDLIIHTRLLVPVLADVLDDEPEMTLDPQIVEWVTIMTSFPIPMERIDDDLAAHLIDPLMPQRNEAVLTRMELLHELGATALEAIWAEID